jgi:hypothetical protein
MDYQLCKSLIFRVECDLVALAVLKLFNFIEERTVFEHVFVGLGKNSHKVVKHQNVTKKCR